MSNLSLIYRASDSGDSHDGISLVHALSSARRFLFFYIVGETLVAGIIYPTRDYDDYDFYDNEFRGTFAGLSFREPVSERTCN